MVKEVYCPLCLNKGRKKLLGKIDDKTEGKLYLWCKSCKQEIEIDLTRKKQNIINIY